MNPDFFKSISGFQKKATLQEVSFSQLALFFNQHLIDFVSIGKFNGNQIKAWR